MTDKPNAFHTLGLELNTHSLKGVQLNQRKGKPQLGRLYEIPIKSETATASEAFNLLNQNEEGQGLLASVPKNLVITPLNTGDVLVRQLEVKLKKDSDIDAVLAFQSEPLLPYPSDQAIIDRISLAETADGTQLTILAARKDHIQHHLEQWKNRGIEPEIVSCAPAALAEFAKVLAPSQALLFVVHIGPNTTSCVLVKEGKLVGAQAFFQGVQHLRSAYFQDHPNATESAFTSLDFAAFDTESHPGLLLTLESMRLEITRTLYALTKLAKGQEIGHILITGEGGALTQLGFTLCQTVNIPIAVPASNDNFQLPAAQLQRFAIPIGAALTGLPGAQNCVDFRQQELSYPNPWKRYKTPLAIYLGLCLLLALAAYFAGNAYTKYHEDGLRQQYSGLLQSMHRPYSTLEQEFAAKAAGKKQPEQTAVPPIQSLTSEDIMARLRYLENDLQSTPDIYPLLPNVPTVSDVLAWLSTNPNVTAKDPKTGALKPLIQLETFNYSYVKRPEQTKKQDKYQVKVEIEFSSPTPKMAREFHDALITPNAMVDPKGEVKWNTNRGLYRASFFLKDKTLYPTSS